MQSPPTLFDPELLARRRDRAARGPGKADFLREAVAHEVSERLSEINRSFRDPVVIGPRGPLWAEILGNAGLPPPRLIPDTDTLDLRPESADLVVHALALHWANDPVGQLAQSRRALRPDGLLIAALFAGETLQELRQSLAAAEIECLGGLSPRIAPMGEIRELGGLLGRAGFAMPVADSSRYDVTYPSAVDLMRDLRAMGETNVMTERLRRPMRRDMLALAARTYAERFGTADGRVPATFEVVFLTGWAPSPDQPRALRPGSAKARLADALGTHEQGTDGKPRP